MPTFHQLLQPCRLILGVLSLCVSSAIDAGVTSRPDQIAEYRAYQLAVDRWFKDHPELFGEQASAAMTMSAASHATKYATPRRHTREAIEFRVDTIIFGPDPADEPYDSPDVEEQMLRLAQVTGRLRAQLDAGGYPKAVYEMHVRRFEATSLKGISDGRPNPIDDDAAVDRLIRNIDRERVKVDASLPTLHFERVAYSIRVRPVILRSNPLGGDVWIISELRFDVCKEMLHDPHDFDGCKQWREADPRNPMYLAGTYAFQVLWKGGKNARGQRTIYNDSSETPLVYILP
jgi:hypothetical protein